MNGCFAPLLSNKSGMKAAGRSTAVLLEQRMEGEAVLAWVGWGGLGNQAAAFLSPKDEAACAVPGSVPTPREQHNKSLQLSARDSTWRISCRLKKLATFFQIGAATELHVMLLKRKSVSRDIV